MQGAKHQMPGERCLNTHLGRFSIPHFTNENHVWSLAKHRTDNAGKIETDVVTNFHLIDPGEVILHRILGGDDLCIWTIEFIERGIERGRFSRTGWAGNKNNAVGTSNQIFEISKIPFRKPELPNTNADIILVENPHDDALSVIRWQHADSQIVILTVGGDLDSTVLRAATLGNVEL